MTLLDTHQSRQDSSSPATTTGLLPVVEVRHELEIAAHYSPES
jgi:hypothetical protein